MATLVHPSALEQDGNILTQLKSYRIAPVGTPLNKGDTLIVGWEMRHKAARLLPDRLISVRVLNPCNEDPCILTKGIAVERRDGEVLMQSYQKRAQDNGYRLFGCMPKNWKGKTWFSMGRLRDLARSSYAYLLGFRTITTYTRDGEIELDITSYCRPEDCAAYVREGVTPRYKLSSNNMPVFKTIEDAKSGNAVYTPETFHVLPNGQTVLTLKQCLEYLPHDTSVMGTIANWPYELIPRGYLEWLVSDGEIKDKILSTALEGPNSLRDSILSYLSETTVIKTYHGKLEEENRLRVIGNCNDNPATRDIRKQFVKLDTETKDLEHRDFCTFGYWVKDTFVAAGTSSPIPFEAHGPATWLEPYDGRRSVESLPDHVKTGLTEFERREKWTPAERENYDWEPVRISSNFNRALEHLFSLHQRLDIWEQRHDFLLRRRELEMSERDQEDLDWEFKEHELEMSRIKVEYQGILSLHKDSIPPEWGIKERILKLRVVASYDARMMADLIEDMLEYAKTEEDRLEKEQMYILRITYKVNEWRKIRAEYEQEKKKHLQEARLLRPALDWEEVESMLVRKDKTTEPLRWALRYAKTQNPNPRKRRTSCFL
jgi:hypothetical protein